MKVKSLITIGMVLSISLATLTFSAATPAGAEPTTRPAATKVASSVGGQPERAPAYVSNAYWTGWPSAPRLNISPTAYGYAFAITNLNASFGEALRKSGLWYWTTSLFEQFWCHAYVHAPGQWNLEANRPVVSRARMLAARCNP